MSMSNRETYRKMVDLLLKIVPSVYDINEFAVHGGTAINLFRLNMPRYSVDLDITYIPLAGREESLNHINELLSKLRQNILKSISGIQVTHKTNVWKLICIKDGILVKLEVNGTKRGLIGNAETVELCNAAQQEFQVKCNIHSVSNTLLYGGKIAAALSRQHPRDLFDIKHMEYPFPETREGLLFCLLGSDRPLHESFAPALIDQRETLDRQFAGMTDIPFTYDDFEQTREKLIRNVNTLVTDADKEFLVSFERAEPDWNKFDFSYFQDYPSVQWKLINLQKLKTQNPEKLKAEALQLEYLW